MSHTVMFTSAPSHTCLSQYFPYLVFSGLPIFPGEKYSEVDKLVFKTQIGPTRKITSEILFSLSCKDLPGAAPVSVVTNLCKSLSSISDIQAKKFCITENSFILLSCVTCRLLLLRAEHSRASRQEQEFPFPNNFLDILQLLPLRKLIQSLQLQHQQFLLRGKLSKNTKSTFLQHTQTHSWLPNNGFFFWPNLSLQGGEKECTGQVMPNGFF